MISINHTHTLMDKTKTKNDFFFSENENRVKSRAARHQEFFLRKSDQRTGTAFYSSNIFY